MISAVVVFIIFVSDPHGRSYRPLWIGKPNQEITIAYAAIANLCSASVRGGWRRQVIRQSKVFIARLADRARKAEPGW